MIKITRRILMFIISFLTCLIKCSCTSKTNKQQDMIKLILGSLIPNKHHTTLDKTVLDQCFRTKKNKQNNQNNAYCFVLTFLFMNLTRWHKEWVIIHLNSNIILWYAIQQFRAVILPRKGHKAKKKKVNSRCYARKCEKMASSR